MTLIGVFGGQNKARGKKHIIVVLQEGPDLTSLLTLTP